MTDSPSSSGDGLFAGTAWHYARYRPGYPETFFADVVARFRLDGTGRLLDLGCGTGQLTVPLARHVTEALGVDPEPEMLVEAANRARELGVTNVSWAQGSSEDLPGEFGRFTLVTMGRSFHWMDRERVLSALDGMVEADGGVVMANDSCLVRPVTEWQRAVEALQPRYLPADAFPSLGPASSDESHESILSRSPFPNVHRVVQEFTREWTVDAIIGYLYSTSLPLRRLLGDRRSAFEQEVATTLLAIEPSGRFTEPVALEVHTATRG
ncbi:methyltransferase type 11 [Mycobacterium sp. Root135]|uniref:class I SAM-dependent methyltransferase n=1 Tax=Mycobacterium sp. Root135 TaxID=1736457 RepID=UPI0006F65677|nr:class I SAM-dependent methyltransferase [Mycobacterium sp. Root135]KQY07577.1 methyltransferase type 11 [Mycobacterium sp. Root135]